MEIIIAVLFFVTRKPVGILVKVTFGKTNVFVKNWYNRKKIVIKK